MQNKKQTIKRNKKICFLLLLFFLKGILLFGEYPEIGNLDPGDILYAQLEAGISSFYQAAAQDREMPPLQIFSYTTKTEQSIFSLAAKCNLPYESIATLNRIDNSGNIRQGTRVLVPSIPGLFVPFEAESELEHLLQQSVQNGDTFSVPIILNLGEKKIPYHFIPGRRFSSQELSYFLGVYFRYPVPRETGTVSSLFGQRRSPFTGELSFHYGIDIAADLGADVYASRFGLVIKKGFDQVYGNYVLIEHSDNYKTFYGHLNYLTVELHQKVKSGSIIGTIGSTGLSTGPHLHFEIWKNNTPVDPLLLLPKDY